MAGRLSYVSSHMNFDVASPDDVIWFGSGYDGTNWWQQRDQRFSDRSDQQTVQRKFRNDGALLSVSVQSGVTSLPSVSYAVRYDSAGRPVTIDDGATPVVNRYWEGRGLGSDPVNTASYDALGRLSNSFMDNGSTRSGTAFDSYSNLPTSYWDSTVSSAYGVKPSSPNMFNATNMTYQGTKLTGYSESVGANTFSMSYDRDGRLKSATASPSGTSTLQQSYNEQNSFFVGDGASTVGTWPNNTTQAALWDLQFVNGIGGSSRTYAYDPAHPEEAITYGPPSPANQDSVTYDANGLVHLHTPAVGSVVQFDYDAQNRLQTISSGGAMEENLSYDATGGLARRQFAAGSSTISTFYVGADITLLVKPTGTIAEVHVLLGGQRVTTVWQTSTGTQGVTYYHRDRLGSVIETSTAGGILGVGYRYDVYGKLTNTAGTLTDAATSDLGYTGALKLSEGLVYLNARTYDPGLRRFLQPDNVDSRRYTYAGGDPINSTDPSGHAESSQSFWNHHSTTYGMDSEDYYSFGSSGGWGGGNGASGSAQSQDASGNSFAGNIDEFVNGWGDNHVLMASLASADSLSAQPGKGGGSWTQGGEERYLDPATWGCKGDGCSQYAWYLWYHWTGNDNTRLLIETGWGSMHVQLSGDSFDMAVTSGRDGPCMNDPACEKVKNTGPIPRGTYLLNTAEMTHWGLLSAILHRVKGDWGSFRVPLHPMNGTETFGRDGFFLQGGDMPGSAGCVDCGGGVLGNDWTNRLTSDLMGAGDYVTVEVY